MAGRLSLAIGMRSAADHFATSLLISTSALDIAASIAAFNFARFAAACAVAPAPSQAVSSPPRAGNRFFWISA